MGFPRTPYQVQHWDVPRVPPDAAVVVPPFAPMMSTPGIILRAAATAYIITAFVPPQSEPQASLGDQTAFANSAQRAANTAYFINLSFVVQSEPQASQGHQTDRAPSAPRAPSDNYWIPPRAMMAEPGIPAGKGHQTDSAPAAKIASLAYSVVNPIPPAEILGGTGYQEHFARGSSRAAVEAYSTIVRRQIDETMPPALGWRTDIAPAARTAFEAYKIILGVPPPSVQQIGLVIGSTVIGSTTVLRRANVT